LEKKEVDPFYETEVDPFYELIYKHSGKDTPEIQMKSLQLAVDDKGSPDHDFSNYKSKKTSRKTGPSLQEPAIFHDNPNDSTDIDTLCIEKRLLELMRSSQHKSAGRNDYPNWNSAMSTGAYNEIASPGSYMLATAISDTKMNCNNNNKNNNNSAEKVIAQDKDLTDYVVKDEYYVCVYAKVLIRQGPWVMSPIIKSISKGEIVECVGFGYVYVANNYRIKRLKLRLTDGEFGWCSTTLSSGNQTVVMEPYINTNTNTPHEKNTYTNSNSNSNSNSINTSSGDKVMKHKSRSRSSPESGDRKATQALNPVLVEDRVIQMHNRSAIFRIFGGENEESDEVQTENFEDFGVEAIMFNGGVDSVDNYK